MAQKIGGMMNTETKNVLISPWELRVIKDTCGFSSRQGAGAETVKEIHENLEHINSLEVKKAPEMPKHRVLKTGEKLTEDELKEHTAKMDEFKKASEEWKEKGQFEEKQLILSGQNFGFIRKKLKDFPHYVSHDEKIRARLIALWKKFHI